MTDLEALAKLASDAYVTPGPWVADVDDLHDCVVWGPTGQWIANVGAWGPDPTPDDVASADALFVAAASPDVVLALVRVALAAKAFRRVPTFADAAYKLSVALDAALAGLDR
jgi:hypothetical protein